ncbi:MAG: AAA family ATPase [Pseudomonadota bacterium]
MYEQHFNLTQSPFSIAPDPRFLYLSTAHREALAHLMYGFSHGGFVMVTGEVGTGKTTLLRNLIKQTPPDLDVAFILNPRLTVRELLATLCDELGVAYDPDRTTTVKQYIDLITRHLLATHRAGRSTVMIIDEAQNLSPAVLEQVRLLTNLETDDKKLLRIILIGQPELADMLDRQDLRQLAQRITARYHLGSLSRPDTYAYVLHRMSRAGGNPKAFSAGALRRIYALSKGTPRLINVIADRALLGAYTEGRAQVTGRIVSRAAREVLGKPPMRRSGWLGAAAAVGVAGAAYALLGPISEFRNPEPAPVAETTPATAPQTTPTSESPEPGAPALSEETLGENALSEQRSNTGPLNPASPDTEAQVTSRPELLTTAASAAATPTTEADRPAPPIGSNADGEAVITPETYARMQAARSQPTQSRKPTAAAPTGTVPQVAEISRPAGSTFASRRQAYGAVFDRWGVDYGLAPAEQIPCDFAPSAGLQCLSARGEWGQLNRVDLPVILELWDEQPAPYYAALLAMQDGIVQLQLGEERLETTQRALREQWSGNYVILWQTPPGYQGSLRSGQTHETVGWLRQQLTGIVGASLASPTPNRFDEQLREAVVEFQRDEGLTPDGIVGPDTWIRLAHRLRLPQPSLAG